MYNYDKETFIRELMKEIYDGNIKTCRLLYLENIKYLFRFLYDNFDNLKFVERGKYLFLELRFDIKRLIKKEGYEIVVYTRNGKKRWEGTSVSDAIKVYTKKDTKKAIYPVWVGNAGDIGIDLKRIIDYYVTCKDTPVIALEKRLSKQDSRDLNYLIDKLSRMQKA